MIEKSSVPLIEPPPVIKPGQSKPEPVVEPVTPKVEIDREEYHPSLFPNPALYMQTLYPDLTLHAWQFELLMAFAGYIDPRKYTDLLAPPDMRWTKEERLRLALSICNGGGKDRLLICACAAWLVLNFRSARAIVTSSSHKQLKDQTEPHIKGISQRHNNLFSKTFDSIHYRHSVPRQGSQIELFCTDDPDFAEGYHPWENGPMALFFNEAKSIPPEILLTARRWTGYSHWIYISSAGRKAGPFYEAFTKARNAGRELPKAILMPNEFYCRQITQFECPHIPISTIEENIADLGLDSPFIQSTVFSNFSDFVEGSFIAPGDFELSDHVGAEGRDIGIGWDFAAGGDENAIYVRQGNKVVFSKFWVEQDTTVAMEQFHEYTLPWFDSNYELNADNGGIGQGFIDNLKRRGWRIRRRNNQSAAYNSALYANLGAEMYGHYRRLLQTGNVCIKDLDSKTKAQLLARQVLGEDSNQGKIALLPKKLQRTKTGESPDRADSMVLCFFSHKPDFIKMPEVAPIIDDGFIDLHVWKSEQRALRRRLTLPTARGNEIRTLFGP